MPLDVRHLVIYYFPGHTGRIWEQFKTRDCDVHHLDQYYAVSLAAVRHE